MKRFLIRVVVVFLLAPFAVKPAGAARELAAGSGDESNSRKATGTITIGGKVTVDGSLVQTGAAVADGSTIATLADGDASIDLGQLGRIQLRPNTTIKLTIAPNGCQVLMQRCGSMTQVVPVGVSAEVKYDEARQVEVAVTRGKVRINWERREGNAKTDSSSVGAIKRKILRRTRDVSTNGDSTFTLNCCGCCFEPSKKQNSITRAEP